MHEVVLGPGSVADKMVTEDRETRCKDQRTRTGFFGSKLSRLLMCDFNPDSIDLYH
jgi:hypothetical protein